MNKLLALIPLVLLLTACSTAKHNYKSTERFTCGIDLDDTRIVEYRDEKIAIFAKVEYFNERKREGLRSVSKLFVYQGEKLICEGYFREDIEEEFVDFFGVGGAYKKDKKGRILVFGGNYDESYKFGNKESIDPLFAFIKEGAFNIQPISNEELRYYYHHRN